MGTVKPLQLECPPKIEKVSQWLVFGIDPSLSRTGYALMDVTLPPDSRHGQPCDHPGCLSHVSHPCEGCGRMGGLYPTRAEWLSVGSVKPEVASDPVWVRSKGMALHLKGILMQAACQVAIENVRSKLSFSEAICVGTSEPIHYDELGLLISMEFPTPRNDFLVSINRILHLVFFEDFFADAGWRKFETVRFLSTNAATLRSVMGLTQKGTKNKAENLRKAYDFISQNEFPRLDPDSCDGVLLAMMGRYAASVLLERPREVPDKALAALCSAKLRARGRGERMKISRSGLLLQPDYFYQYSSRDYAFMVRNARLPSVGLTKVSYMI